MCQVTDTREYLILGREKVQQVYKDTLHGPAFREVSLASVSGAP